MTHRVEIEHKELGKYRVISGKDIAVVRRKADLQIKEWNSQWERIVRKEDSAREKADKVAVATGATRDAQQSLDQAGCILQQTLNVNDQIDWERLKSYDHFHEIEPMQPDFDRFSVRMTFLDYLFFNVERKRRRAEQSLQLARQSWEQAQKAWSLRREAFLNAQSNANEAIERLKLRYLAGEPEAIEEYCDLVLSRSKYPATFPQQFQTVYDESERLIVVDYELPSLDSIPTLREVRYVASRDDFVKKYISEKDKQRLYDSLCYQICLRTVHELFEADICNAVNTVVFNGFVHFVDQRNGRDTRSCIMSLQAGKEVFNEINLARIDPKDCFRSLKGIGSSQLHGMIAVPPVLQLKKDDPRFVESQDVAHKLDDETNVAALGWEEFEHLIREIFAQEFSGGGAEVKVTRSSRDGGVDAVAFDPDPIRGGKIVIQAKRYTNTVGVSAVRDLFGAVSHEGAIKGILVTTSTFGKDAYRFASEKPLSLIDGSGLLHLLEKHGRKARIDLAEAKKLGMALQR